MERSEKENRKYVDSIPEASFEDAPVVKEAAKEVRHECPRCHRLIDPPMDLGSRMLIACGGCKLRKTYAKK